MKDSLDRVLNFAAFYLGWFACVVGTARGLTIMGPVVVAALLLLHLMFSSDRVRELQLIVWVGALGFAIDSSQAALGIFTFVGAPGVWICPPWLVALWMNFAGTLNKSMSWLGGRPTVAAVMGAVSGPVSYIAAARIGVIVFPNPLVSLIVLSIVWALVVPGLFVLRDALAQRGAARVTIPLR